MQRNKLRLYILSNQRALKKALQVIEEDAAFNGNRMITRDGIPNLNLRTVKLKEFIEKYFFPPVAPSLILSLNGADERDFGDLSNAFLHWTVIKKTSGVTRIQIGGIDLAPAYPDQEIDQDADEFNNSNSGVLESPVYYEDNTVSFSFFMYVTDTLGNIYSRTCALYFLNRRYWFAEADNLADASEEALSAYLNAIVSTSELGRTRIMNKTVACHHQYLYMFWPVAWGGDNNHIKLNGKIVNDWEQRDFYHTNPYQFRFYYRLFRSRYKLFAPYGLEVTEASLP